MTSSAVAAAPQPLTWIAPQAPAQEAPQEPVEVKMAGPAVPQQQNDPFAALSCSPDEQLKVATVVDRLAAKRYAEFEVIKELRQIEKDLKDLHPFRFLWVIYSNPDLKRKVKTIIFSDFVAKIAFLGGINKTMRAKTDAGEIDPYVAGFAQEVGTTKEKLEPLLLAGAKARNWKLLVGHLNG